MIGLFFGGIIKTALGFLKGLPPWVWYLIAGIALGLFLWHLHSGAEKRAYNGAYAQGVAAQKVITDREIEKNRITTNSLNEALSDIRSQNLAVEKMVDESNARLKAGSDALATAKQTRNATQSAVQALKASAGRTGPRDAPCVPSEAFLKNSGAL